MFLRLNTGSVTLSPQELRQALKPGPFSDWLDIKSIESAGLKTLLGTPGPDRRMVDAELLLRHLALLYSPFTYSGNLKRFLDEATGAFNIDWEVWEPQLEAASEQLEAAIRAAVVIFEEENVCRKWTKNKWERPFNRAIFDFIMLSFSNAIVREACIPQKDELVSRFKSLCDRSRAFSESISATTKTPNAFRTRINAWHRIVKDVAGVDFAKPPTLFNQ